MAGPHKKRIISNSEAAQNDPEEILADFEGRNPEPQDFEGIKQLLKQLFLKEHIDLSHLTDLLLRQEGLGSVLKQSWNDEDDEEDELAAESDVFGITTVLNLAAFKSDLAVQQLFEFFKNKVTTHDNSNAAKIQEILDGQRVGLLINERFVNIPAKIADPLLATLEQEIIKMKKRDSNYNFDHYVMICKTYKPKDKNSESIFSNAEEEVFTKEADISIEYSVSDQCDTGVGGEWSEEDSVVIPHRRLLFISGNKFSKIVDEVKKFVA